MTKKSYIEFIFLILLGAITSLSLPPFNYLIVNFITLSLLFIFLIKSSKRTFNKKLFFLYGWLFGFGYFITNLYWISISLTFDKSFKFLMPLALVLIPAFLALFYGLIFYLFFILKTKKTVASFFLFSLIFGLLEYIRGSILTGFPWNLIAYSFSNYLEILNITSVIGTYGFNLFCISLFMCPALFILRGTRTNIFVSILLFLMIIVFYILGSQSQKYFDEIVKKSLEYKVRVVGSNIKIERFYNNIDPIKAIEDLIEFSKPDKNEKIIFIWPEGILPGISQDKLDGYKWLFEKNFNENHLIVLGINSKSIEKGNVKHFNSLSVYDHSLNLLNSYNKINLVPFGEFLPLENILKKIGLKTLTNNYQSYSKGTERNIIKLDKNNFSLKFLPLICYEIIYSGKIFKSSNFDFIVNISEDGWFGKSIGPKQHLVHSIFRAIESGKYVLRSSNNGTSVIINPLGIIEQQVDFSENGYIDFTQYKKIEPTVFSKYGNKIFGLIILLYIFLFFSFNKMNNE